MFVGVGSSAEEQRRLMVYVEVVESRKWLEIPGGIAMEDTS